MIEEPDYVSLGAFQRFYPFPDGRPVDIRLEFFDVTRTIEWLDEVVVHSTVGSHGYGGEESGSHKLLDGWDDFDEVPRRP